LYGTSYSSDIIVESKSGYVDIVIENPWDSEDNSNLIILREDNKGLSLQKVCEIPLRSMMALGGDKNNIKDYNVASNNKYTYYFAVKTGGEYNDAYEVFKSESVTTEYHDWFVIGLSYDNQYGYNVDVSNIWSFGLSTTENIVEQYKHNYNKTVHDGFGKHASLSVGIRNYAEFTINCLIGDVNCSGEYYDDIDMVEAWNEFCHSSFIKLYKEPKGRIMLVDAMSNEDKNNIWCNENPTTISTAFAQVGTTRNTPIYTWGLI
jgi:hypothetical protein